MPRRGCRQMVRKCEMLGTKCRYGARCRRCVSRALAKATFRARVDSEDCVLPNPASFNRDRKRRVAVDAVLGMVQTMSFKLDTRMKEPGGSARAVGVHVKRHNSIRAFENHVHTRQGSPISQSFLPSVQTETIIVTTGVTGQEPGQT